MRRLGLERRLVYISLLLAGTVGEAAAQLRTDYAPADIEYGIGVYRSECEMCHGESGADVAGVALRSGPFRRASSDRELRALITNGIPDTAMPAFQFAPPEMTGIIAYLRNMNYESDVVTIGDVGRGRAIFAGKGDCYRCHRIGDRGRRVAPDLTAIGRMQTPSALRQSLLDPTGTMQPINRPVEIVTADGERVMGRRINEDTYTVQIIDSEERLRSFDKADLREYSVLTESPMPSSEGTLSGDELADLLAYLVSLKGLNADGP